MGQEHFFRTLPKDFIKRMEALLGEEYKSFAESYEKNRAQGLRFNGQKGDIEKLYERYREKFGLRPVPWCREGFYYRSETRPGRNPLHEAGLYYIQEPSAMAVVSLLDPGPGEKILDLCAAPGGKSTHIASKIGNNGLLISNEIHPARAKILSRNVERMGLVNTVVTNEDSKKLAEVFPEFFDKVVVDAPCSGEGMFRKDEQAQNEWSRDNVRLCAVRQAEILDNGAKLLRWGGRMVYSTCTFSPEENEQQIEKFLERHPEFSVVHLPEENRLPGLSAGKPEWSESLCAPVGDTFRIWPHLAEGEGHYLALLIKKERESGKETDKGRRKGKKEKPEYQWNDPVGRKILREFFDDILEEKTRREAEKNKNEQILFGEQVYQLPKETPSLDGIKVLRPGLHLGMLHKNRFEPSQGLAMTLRPDQVKRKLCLNPEEEAIRRYLAGETLAVKESWRGWVLVCADQYPVGWGKASNGMLKNHYPKGLRISAPVKGG